MAQNIPTNKARQGRWGSQVLIVLLVALALAGGVWVGLEFYGESIDEQSTGQPGAVEQSKPGASTQPGQGTTSQ